MSIPGSNPLPGVGPTGPTPLSPSSTGKGGETSSTSFADVLRNSIREVNDLQIQADNAIRDLTLGKTNNVTDVVNQVEKADLAFRALLAVRNKLVEAYEEINRLRV